MNALKKELRYNELLSLVNPYSIFSALSLADSNLEPFDSRLISSFSSSFEDGSTVNFTLPTMARSSSILIIKSLLAL